jgi:chromosome segregation ATPase
MILGLIIALASVGIIFGALTVLKKRAASTAGAEVQSAGSKLPELESQIKEIIASASALVSKKKLENISAQIEAAQTELEKEKANLKEIETRLDQAQKLVEEKEGVHQEMKSSKEEDEMRLKDMMERYSDLSSESMALEQKLASSMKNLDQLLSEVTLTEDQRAMFENLSVSLTSSGERMRDLLTEYSTVHERLELLQQQHKDLEEEYTRLVEQQLGE